LNGGFLWREFNVDRFCVKLMLPQRQNDRHSDEKPMIGTALNCMSERH
jgi:hypothetical protein